MCSPTVAGLIRNRSIRKIWPSHSRDGRRRPPGVCPAAAARPPAGTEGGGDPRDAPRDSLQFGAAEPGRGDRAGGEPRRGAQGARGDGDAPSGVQGVPGH